MARPSYNSLKLDANVGTETILYKESQAMMPDQGMAPEMGQSPVTGNPDEMQAPESANQKQYEDDFGSLAYQFVQDRAPALMPYMLGFEVVDRNEDGSKAVGIFGYKVDDDFYYIPAFFLNNQVRGVDLILNKKTNQFVPLVEEWIDYIINRHSVRIGGPGDNRVRESMRSPDLEFVRRPQDALGKVAEDAEVWTFGDAWSHIKEATAKVAADPDFQQMIVGAASAVHGRIEKAAESKYVKDFMKTAGGPEAMLSFFRAMRDADFANAALTLYKDAEAFFTEDLANARIHADRMAKKAAARPKIAVTDKIEKRAEEKPDPALPADEDGKEDTPKANVEDNSDKMDEPLSDEENARQILEEEFTITDVRPREEVSRVSDEEAVVDYERRFQPPDGPGKYEFLMSDGESREGFLFNTMFSDSCGKDGCIVAFKDGDGPELTLASARPLDIITTDMGGDLDKDEAIKEMYDSATAISGIETSDSDDEKAYLFIDNKGNAAGPFSIKFVMSEDGHVRLGKDYTSSDFCIKTPVRKGLETQYGYMDWNLEDRWHDSDGYRTGDRKDGCCCCDCAPCDNFEMISLCAPGGLPRKTTLGLMMPMDWKAIRVKQYSNYVAWKKDESDEDHTKRQNAARKEKAEATAKYTFGTPNDILSEMSDNGIERVKVASDDGHDFYISVGAGKRVGPFGYKAASVQLVTRFGLRPRRAFATLSKAASANQARLLVKYPECMIRRGEKQAQEMLSGVSMPYPVEQIPATDPYAGIPVYSSPYVDVTQGQTYGYPQLPIQGGMTHGINYGGEMERTMGGQEVPDEHNEVDEGILPIDQQAQQLAEEAAAAGQRHVFDQAAIGGLAKVYDTANVVDSYIPDFMDTIDRLGRILFLFYWKHEDFNKRYGSDDIVQMEDRLRSVFKQLGTLTLQLKEKAVQKD